MDNASRGQFVLSKFIVQDIKQNWHQVRVGSFTCSIYNTSHGTSAQCMYIQRFLFSVIHWRSFMGIKPAFFSNATKHVIYKSYTPPNYLLVLVKGMYPISVYDLILVKGSTILKNIPCLFYAPASIDRGILFYRCPSVCPSVCLSAKNL